MKEITRIHIAKVAYDIELDAKEDIQKYIKALERYAEDEEILSDIEIRITELLGERGVAAGGVITKDDVQAVRAQLGEPSEFASIDPDYSDESELDAVENEPRRVYRDESDAILGGVLSGFAKFFGIDPLWLRLIFVMLLLGSFGTALVVYLVMWLVIPPARTSAEKLRMNGRAVTLASIKELAGNEEQRNQKAVLVRQILAGAAGVVLLLMAVGALFAAFAVPLSTMMSGSWNVFGVHSSEAIYASRWFMAAMGLFVASGLLFSALCFILASALFRRQWSKRIGVAVGTIIAAGLMLFAAGIGTGFYGVKSEQVKVDELRATTSVDLPATFMNIKTLSLPADKKQSLGHATIEYIVADTPRYELEALPGSKPSFVVADDSLSASVTLTNVDSAKYPWIYTGPLILRIYGPALDTLEVANNGQSVHYYNERTQENMTVKMSDGVDFKLAGRYGVVTVRGVGGATASLENATIEELRTEGGRITAGVVRTLSVKQAEVCPVRDFEEVDHYVQVRAVSSGMLTYNGSEQPAASIEKECGTVVIGDNHEEEGEY